MSRTASTEELTVIAQEDIMETVRKDEEYGASWKQRGGVGAFMMLARKWDRIEEQVQRLHYDIFEAIFKDTRDEGLIDDIRDLRRYLLLVENHIRQEPVKAGLLDSGEPGPGYVDQD